MAPVVIVQHQQVAKTPLCGCAATLQRNRNSDRHRQKRCEIFETQKQKYRI